MVCSSTLVNITLFKKVFNSALLFSKSTKADPTSSSGLVKTYGFYLDISTF